MAESDFEDEHLLECVVATKKVINEGGLPHNLDINDKRWTRIKVYYNLLKSADEFSAIIKVVERLSKEKDEFIVNFIYAFIGNIDVHSFMNETDDDKETYTSQQYLYMCHVAKHVHSFQEAVKNKYKMVSA
jgi:hypothetical protein